MMENQWTNQQSIFPLLARNACVIGSVIIHVVLILLAAFVVAGRMDVPEPVDHPMTLFVLADEPTVDPGVEDEPVVNIPEVEKPPEIPVPDPVQQEPPEIPEPKEPELAKIPLPDPIVNPIPDPIPIPVPDPFKNKTPPDDPTPTLTPGNGSSGSSVPPKEPYSGRTEGQTKQQLLESRGGSRQTQSAVLAGLVWLARHQDANGRWDPDGFAKHDPAHQPSMNPASANNRGDRFEVGLTALATLAFLGDGHTHLEGRFQEVVARALGFLTDPGIQRPDGGIGQDVKRRVDMYGHAIATLALSEALAMTGDRRLVPAVRRAVTFIEKNQNRTGGWNYFDTGHKYPGRDDVSITGWQIMALASAENAGIQISGDVYLKALAHLDAMTDSDGRVRYSTKGNFQQRKGTALVGVAAFSRLLMGYKIDARRIRQAAKLIGSDLPNWNKLAHADIRRKPYQLHSMYHWYYGTLVMSQVGGEDWKKWNAALKKTLLQNQNTSGSARGSWNPDGIWGLKYGGRIYSTALNILNLEVYYRLLPLYQVKGNHPLVAPLVRQLDKQSSPRKRMDLVEILSDLATEKTDVALHHVVINDRSGAVRLAAINALGQRKSKRFLVAAGQFWKKASTKGKLNVLKWTGPFENLEALIFLITAVADPDPEVARRAGKLFEEVSGHSVGKSLPVASHESGLLRRELLAWIESTDKPLLIDRTRRIMGLVLATLPQQGMLIVDMGASDGIVKGNVLKIYRQGKLQGVCRVEQIFADRALARFDAGSTAVIRQGDKVEVRVGIEIKAPPVP